MCLYKYIYFVCNSVWLYPGQTDQIAIDILIPSGTQDTVNTLTVRIIGTEIADKTVYIYVQNAFSKVNIRKYWLLQKYFL